MLVFLGYSSNKKLSTTPVGHKTTERPKHNVNICLLTHAISSLNGHNISTKHPQTPSWQNTMFNYSMLPKNIIRIFNTDVNPTVITKQKHNFVLIPFKMCRPALTFRVCSSLQTEETLSLFAWHPCLYSFCMPLWNMESSEGPFKGEKVRREKKVSDSLRREAAAHQSRSVHVAFQPLCVYVYTHIYTHIYTHRRTQSVLLSCSGTHWRRQHSNREEFTSAL